MKKLIFILGLIISQVACGQKVYYHEYYETASDFAITKWDCNNHDSLDMYVIEKVDEQNRVTELKFMKNGELNFGSLCYLSPWLKFDYPNDSTITVSYLNSEGQPEANIECEVPSMVKYNLTSDKKTIKSSTDEFEFDPIPYLQNGWTKEGLEKAVLELKTENGNTSPFIDYYSKSLLKLNGKFPVSKDFDQLNIYFNEIEKKELKTVGNTVYSK
jgi:hypothetical protein